MISGSPESETMTDSEPKRNFFQTAVYNFFALYLGITPPAPGQELFYASLLAAAAVFLIFCGYLIIHLVMEKALG
jgi:hypothetical protein